MYATDLTDGQWELLKPLFEAGHDPKISGRPRSYPLRAVVDAVLYVTKTGCQWRMLPDSFAPWGAVLPQYWSPKHVLESSINVKQLLNAYLCHSGLETVID